MLKCSFLAQVGHLNGGSNPNVVDDWYYQYTENPISKYGCLAGWIIRKCIYSGMEISNWYDYNSLNSNHAPVSGSGWETLVSQYLYQTRVLTTKLEFLSLTLMVKIVPSYFPFVNHREKTRKIKLNPMYFCALMSCNIMAKTENKSWDLRINLLHL